ncbi:hypothetical protein GGR53DRAFT_142271 [Hypoxylon sp. FL1150]|nr:hypothetical protein GGR53DRAFT_142271 [Hypoxylon sp. FL1150]
MDDLHKFGRFLSGNRRKNQQFSPEACAFMLGAVAGGASHADVADAMNCTLQTVSRHVKRFDEQHGWKSSRPSQADEPAMRNRQKVRLDRLTHRRARINGQSTRDGGRIVPIVKTSTRWRHRPHLRKWRAAKRSGLNVGTHKQLHFGHRRSFAAKP